MVGVPDEPTSGMNAEGSADDHKDVRIADAVDRLVGIADILSEHYNGWAQLRTILRFVSDPDRNIKRVLLNAGGAVVRRIDLGQLTVQMDDPR